MLVEITAGLNSLKAATDIVKGLNAVANQTAINDVKLTLQGHIFDAREALGAAQEAQSAALKRIGELEQEIMNFKNWEAEKQRYELEGLARGFVAYVLKEPERSAAPAHAICTNCYERGFKSILQSNGKVTIHDHAWVCPSCKASFACQSRNMENMFQNLNAIGAGA